LNWSEFDLPISRAVYRYRKVLV